MEVNGYNHFDQSSYLINELTQGMELAIQLRDQMGPQYSPETKHILVQQIVSSYDKALSLLGCGASAEQPHQPFLAQSPVTPTTPSSILENPNAKEKGKSASAWTKKTKLNSIGLDGPPDDGYSWRKYGQKDILGAKYPRSYYRCTYRGTQNCWATRQVQKSEKDPNVFDIKYRGKHTCSLIRRSKSAPTSPKVQDHNQEDLIAEYLQDPGMLIGFQNGSTTVSNGFHSMEASSYFSMSPCNANVVQQQQQQHNSMGADLADMIIAATSSTNSPTIDPELVLSQWSFNPDFPFDDPGFF